MNTMPDETHLARWLDDDLNGTELSAFEASFHPDAALLARRQARREWRSTLAAAIPAAVELPYPEFFNHRLAKTIREIELNPPQTHKPTSPPAPAFWRVWWMPVTALAGMTLAFWAGTQTAGVTRVVPRTNPALAPVALHRPTVYIPEHGVDAEYFTSPDADAAVIVLEGVEPIPDNLDFSESVGQITTDNLTAATENPEPTEVTQ